MWPQSLLSTRVEMCQRGERACKHPLCPGLPAKEKEGAGRAGLQPLQPPCLCRGDEAPARTRSGGKGGNSLALPLANKK